MKNNQTRDKVLAVGITMLALVVILGIGYAFFSASVSNTNLETVSTQTATLSLKFADNDNGISGNLNLGESITKKFTLENTGSLDAYAKINWHNLVNTYMNGSLTYNLEQSTSENGTYTSIKTGNVPVSSTETTETLKNGILVPVNTTYYYKLTITFNNLENVNQNSDINAKFYSYFSLEEGSLSGADKIKNLVSGANTNSVDVITKEAPVGSTCTNTLAYDGTSDNNLRYVGANPCNYVTFNGESPTTQTVYRIIDKLTGLDDWGEAFNDAESCNSAYSSNYDWDNDNEYECQQKTETVGGCWRIIGVMNNVDDGTGKLETRIKLIRATSLGNYDWDSSASGVNSGYGVNDWTQADLKNELNGDYLNTNLQANTNWYNGTNNAQTGVYDYTKGLTSSAQAQIENTKWYLGGQEYSVYNAAGEGTAAKFYGYERGNVVWGSKSGQTCNDGYCPRNLEWTGKVALIYPSDYGYAVGGSVRSTCLGKNINKYNSDSCYTNDWLYINNTYQWLLSPASSNAYYAFHVGNTGTLSYSANAVNNLAVRPAVYLESSVTISGGNGTQSEPYVLE